MDNSETHYIDYDPENFYIAMQLAYADAGGELLYPGDEKEMLLRSVQAVCTSVMANVDNALRLATLRYATGDYLDLIGDNRNCPRNEAQAATATIEIQMAATGTAATIPAGTALTADGKRIFLLSDNVAQTGYAQTVRTQIIAEETGSAGNGLTSGTQMQFLNSYEAVTSVYCVADAAGGQEREEDDVYRERIRQHGLANATTGPQVQYETAAKEVSSLIVDARAVNAGAGEVGVYLILSTQEGAQAIIAQVTQALNAREVRPLTDSVTVSQSEAKEYTLKVQYADENGSGIASAVAEAVEAYQKWQDNTIGRAFNPDRLMASVYQAGASRVTWGTGSNFNGGAVTYTEIAETEHCKGTITIEVVQ